MSKLTAEEIQELEALEREVKEELAEDAAAAQRTHIEALRLRKKLSSKDKKHGRDFAILETKLGVFAIRRPTDTEIDTLSETPDERGAQEKFALQILLEPTSDVVRGLFAEHAGLAPAIGAEGIGLASVRHAENAKK